jgi:putative redox protein
MKISVERVNNACHMVATNDDGNIVHIDGSPDAGGLNQGFRPMQLLAAAAAGCSSIDIIGILEKQRQELIHLKIDVEAEREEGKIPSLFTNIHLHYVLEGDLDDGKVKKAIELSLDKYCSVVRILEKTAQVSYSYEIII